MMAVPDLDTVCMDPSFAKPTVSVIANVVDPVTREPYTRDPRHVARKAEACLRPVPYEFDLYYDSWGTLAATAASVPRRSSLAPSAEQPRNSRLATTTMVAPVGVSSA